MHETLSEEQRNIKINRYHKVIKLHKKESLYMMALVVRLCWLFYAFFEVNHFQLDVSFMKIQIRFESMTKIQFFLICGYWKWIGGFRKRLSMKSKRLSLRLLLWCQFHDFVFWRASISIKFERIYVGNIRIHVNIWKI